MYKSLYEDTDSVKYVTELSPEQRKNFMKLFLNSAYGAMVTNYKENDNMTKDYIFVHVDKEPTIIFKKQIVAISKSGDKAYIQCTNNECYYAKESYADIVKQLV